MADVAVVREHNMKKGIWLENLPLGVHRYGEDVSFCVSFPAEKNCTIKLYHRNEDEPFLVQSMMQSETEKGVFSIVLPCDTACGAEYLYGISGGDCVDPYARRVTGRDVFGICDVSKKVRAVVDFAEFDWQGDCRIERDFSEMIMYKLHVRGFTKHPSSHVKDRGTFLGVIQKCEYLKELGVNAVLLLPCVEFNEILLQNSRFIGEPIAKRTERSEKEESTGDSCGRVNYWGYGSNAYYFAPKASFAADPENSCIEFKQMVKVLHSEGIEVFIDMDFADGVPQSEMLEVLRFWHSEYHIDGFRLNCLQIPSRFAANDRRLQGAKIFSADIADASGCNAGLPANRRLAVFDDGFMYDVRRFLKGDEGMVTFFRDRVRANCENAGTVNYITNHDGFTLYDLYSYDVKHNEQNGEKNNDGNEFNFSWNCGIEGETKSRKIMDQRLRMCKNAMAALFLSQGVPMLLAGDEFLNSQQGNNNAYCQDNEISWIKWKNDKFSRSMSEFVRQIIMLRQSHRALRNRIPLRGTDYISCGSPDISFHGVRPWYPDYSNYSRTLGIMLSGSYANQMGKGQEQCVDANFYIIFNMHWEEHEFDLPTTDSIKGWKYIMSTASLEVPYEQGKPYESPVRSVTLFVSEKVNPVAKKKSGRKEA